MFFRLPGILSKESLAEVRAIYDAAPFVDGRQTAGPGVEYAKNNTQIDRTSKVQKQLNAKVKEILAKNNDFQVIAQPRYVHDFLFSRYGEGMEYGDHTDNPLMDQGRRSDMSITIFLNDPSEYEGGELMLNTDISPQAIKLPAGDAVVYPTFMLHRVDKVRKGQRLVAVTWIESLIRDANQRQILLDLAQTLTFFMKSLPEGQGYQHMEYVRLNKVYQNLLRMWAET
jgi:PKHD-type hydroxylase